MMDTNDARGTDETDETNKEIYYVQSGA
ncbi:MAG: hypothetical protein JWR21_1267, partial [Herminiimonas sp.]|nr:hypothetical protein [Herminiimonas sp.]MDB5852965.1 hypothetical protein [Herminiimonas sp.]MDB5853730.1 hypothetical protein [Herminiimonas sp.]